MSSISQAAGNALRSARAATSKAGSRMWHRTRNFFLGQRSGMPRAARAVPLATMGVGSDDAHTDPSLRSGLGHFTVTSDGQRIQWTPTHLWRTSPFEYRACKVLEWASDHATIVDNTGVYEIAHSELQALRAETRVSQREQEEENRTNLSVRDFTQSASPAREVNDSMTREIGRAHV